MTRRLVGYALVTALCLNGAALRAELPPLIPRQDLFGNPDKASPRISPDGKRLAYLAPDEGVLNVWIRTLGRSDDRAVTRDRGRGIRRYFWAHNNEQILYLQDKQGAEDWHLYAVLLATGDVKDLTPFPGVQARFVADEQSLPDELLVALNKRDPSFHDVYRVDLRTGQRTLEAKNELGLVEWLADHYLNVRAGIWLTSSGGMELMTRDDRASAWRTFRSWDPEDVLTSGPIAFTADGGGLYVISSAGSDTGELRRIDLATGEEKTLASDPQADVAGWLIHPTKYTVQAVSFRKEKVHWKLLDKSIKKDLAAIKRLQRGDFRVVNRDHADRVWLIAFTADDGPVSYYVYERETRHAERLFTSRSALEDLRLARMRPISFHARDGLLIHGYLTTPRGVRARNLPMVLLVRSRPWGRDKWGYNGVVQWLANRGYAVLQVNFRGSTGYGKRFLNAADREWGGRMHTDLIDGVRFAVRKRVADPARVAIFGSLYGGYATLVGLAFAPEVFRCGVDISGPTNLITWMETTPPYWKPIEPLLWARVGHPVKDAEFLRSRSPVFHVDKITSPLLIAQGANDPRVKPSESLQIVEALRKAGRDVEYVEYPDEGHGFARPENRLDFYAKAEKFLAKHVGGRYEE